MSNNFEKELYNKLWENINNKDMRVWGFLSLYAASIAIVLSGDVSD